MSSSLVITGREEHVELAGSLAVLVLPKRTPPIQECDSEREPEVVWLLEFPERPPMTWFGHHG